MTALLLKDLRLLLPWAWLLVPGHVLFVSNAAFSPEAFFWTNVALSCLFTVGLLLAEWVAEAEGFIASLPVERTEVVTARYLGALAAAALGTGLFALYCWLLDAVASSRLTRIWGAVPSGWLTWEGPLSFFLAVCLLAFLFLPCHFRLGLGRGGGLFLATVLPLLLALGLLRGVPGGRSELPSQLLRTTLSRLGQAWGVPAAAATTLATVLLVGALSLAASRWAYERRDL